MPSLKPPASIVALAGISAFTSAATAVPIVYFLAPRPHAASDAEIKQLPVKTVVASTTSLNPFLLRPEYAAGQVKDPLPTKVATTAPTPEPADDEEYAVAKLEVVPVTVDRLPDLELPQMTASDFIAPLPPPRPSIRATVRALGAKAQRAIRVARREPGRPLEARLSYGEPVAVSSRYLNPRNYPAQLLPGGNKIAVTAPVAPAKREAPTSSPAVMPVSQGPTAVYDISSATLYLPNGDRLEAHSGRKQNRDNAKAVHLRNEGPTPPGEYILSMREKPFYGVNALRMTPTRASYTFGRDGFLAHSYLAGPGGDSHGCLSVKNYAKLLRAYRNGQVKQITVVKQYGPVKSLAGSIKRWWLASSRR
ncbi:DUF2778 domain-containing protein [Labrys sp. 22185]|uniref:DUF2778 domain-containing protein n=1 Tax=Labrys sp. 22185 TaxID=3453888 RepID=UPI003F84DC44